MTVWSTDIDMQITNSVVCDASKGCIYKQIKRVGLDSKKRIFNEKMRKDAKRA